MVGLLYSLLTRLGSSTGGAVAANRVMEGEISRRITSCKVYKVVYTTSSKTSNHQVWAAFRGCIPHREAVRWFHDRRGVSSGAELMESIPESIMRDQTVFAVVECKKGFPYETGSKRASPRK